MSIIGWLGLNFLIKILGTLFFGVLGGLSLAGGFELFKQLKNRFLLKRRTKEQESKNKSFLDNLEQQILASSIVA